MLSEIPVLPGLHIDAQHVIGAPPQPAERAWFDVIALADGRTAMLVGDLVGPGSESALGTARLRTILNEMLPNRQDLDAVVGSMSKATVDGGSAVQGTTLSVAVLDPRDGNLHYSTCAHPPPLVVTADGLTRPLRPTGAEDPESSLSSAIEREHLAPDDVLVMHTGDRSPLLGPAFEPPAAAAPEADELARADGGDQPAPAPRTEEVCRATAAMIGQGGTQHDLAIVAVQLKPPVPRLKLIVPGVVESLAPAAQAVGDWLAALRSSIEDGAGMALAMGEAVTNAIQHAFVGGRPGSVQVECRLLADGMLVCSVRDDGRWLPSESSRRDRTGRGLRLMARLCDRIQIRREVSGTVVELWRRLHHPVIRSVAMPSSG
ncbi:MAG: SpoIIE family protein phosphatase [Actinomycetota bacterium]|nr:SpoIIE family protein phosphatase [Actinomycetota bacterium]